MQWKKISDRYRGKQNIYERDPEISCILGTSFRHRMEHAIILGMRVLHGNHITEKLMQQAE